MPLVTLSPALGDPVVLRGVKYRITSLTASTARLRDWGSDTAVADPRDMEWDAAAELWRVERRR